MKAEKIDRNKQPRTLQQRRGGAGASEFADNRPGGMLRPGIGAMQRQEDEDEPLQGRFGQSLQREEEDEPIQGRSAEPVQKRNETGMPDNLKAGIEYLSGFSMDDVRVHYNSDKPAAVQALAYTQGTDIHVAPGEERHLPHEAWHVAQQMAGRVEPTTEVGGLPVNDSAELEHEADVMGARAMQLKKNANTTSTFANKAIQRISEEDANQAEFTVLDSATRHGYTPEQLITIMRHRYGEIYPGTECSMLIGQGIEEGYGVYGQILYRCVLDGRGIYHITIFHAHGYGRMG